MENIVLVMDAITILADIALVAVIVRGWRK